MTLIRLLISLVLASLAIAPASFADLRAVYTITGIDVDEEAQTTREAEAKALADAKLIGLRRLISKITLPEDRAKLGADFYNLANANALTAAVDVDGERRSATVYRASLSIVYNPSRVRAQLTQAGVAYLDQQAPLSLVAPVSQDPLVLEAWRSNWPASSEGALNPFITGLAYYTIGDDWSASAEEARGVGATNAVFAQLSGDRSSGYQVKLVRSTPSGSTTLGVTGRVQTLERAVEAATAYLDETWKRQAIVRDARRTSSVANIRYQDLSTWNRIRQALAASTLVTELQVKAVARDGADVSFVYAGTSDRLISDLRQRGLDVRISGSNMDIAAAGQLR